MLLALDPGTRATGYVVMTRDRVQDAGHLPNPQVLAMVRDHAGPIACETIEARGMPLGQDTLTTNVWIGRYWQAADERSLWFTGLKPSEVNVCLCGSTRASDASVRRALIDRFGPEVVDAVGTRRAPGPLYRVKGHAGHGWAALAVGIAWLDTVGRQWRDAA
jgi:hypothetical protein